MKTTRTNKPAFDETIRLAIRTARKSRGLSQTQAAIKFDVSAAAVKRWEHEIPHEFAEFVRYIDALTVGLPVPVEGATAVKTAGLGVTSTLRGLALAQGDEADPRTMGYLEEAGVLKLYHSLRYRTSRALRDSEN